jgi:phage/plasmid primase-like uncharacterized protein
MLNHDIANKARAVRIEDELARRGFPFWTKPRHNNQGHPCPMCGGHDRFSVNTRKQLFNCRGCEASGDVINLVQFLDGASFKTAVKMLAGAAGRQVEPARQSTARRLRRPLASLPMKLSASPARANSGPNPFPSTARWPSFTCG